MRVAFVSAETAHHRGTETNHRFRTVVDLLESRGHDVRVFCTRFWSGGLATFERDGVTYHGLTDPESRRTFRCRVPIALARARPDVVHVNAGPPGQVLAAGLGAVAARVPLVAEWYGDDGVADDRWARLAAGRADRLVVPSELVATWVRERGVDGGGVETVPNPVDLDRIRRVPPDERVDVVYARRLDEEANLESLLLSLAELRRRDWRATVVGDGPERETYERLASDLRIDDRVAFVGNRSLDDRIAAYRGAHVFAQTAERCVFPTELLRALAAGCVGIVEYHANSSAHELVEGWDRGVRTTSEDELTDAIRAVGDLEYRDFEPLFADYDRDAVATRYLKQYRALQDERGVL